MRPPLQLLTAALVLAALLAACGMAPGESVAVDQAAAEATDIIAQAQATAMVLKAQATILIEQAGVHPATPSATPPAGQASRITLAIPTPPSPAAAATARPTPDPTLVELLGVGLAAEGGFIEVDFLAPPEIVSRWWQGSISVVDEVTGMVYNEVPIVGNIGLLIGRPAVTGQAGYAMLVNAPPFLQEGARVTVVLGEFRFEHVLVHE